MSSGDNYEQLIEHFLADQQAVLGDQARRFADDIRGVEVSDNGSVDIQGDGPDAVGRIAEEFRGVFGQSVEESVMSAAREVDHAVEIPPGLGVDRELRGYTEYKKNDGWHVADELGDDYAVVKAVEEFTKAALEDAEDSFGLREGDIILLEDASGAGRATAERLAEVEPRLVLKNGAMSTEADEILFDAEVPVALRDLVEHLPVPLLVDIKRGGSPREKHRIQWHDGQVLDDCHPFRRTSRQCRCIVLTI